MFDMYSTCVQSFKLLFQIVAIVFGTIFLISKWQAPCLWKPKFRNDWIYQFYSAQKSKSKISLPSLTSQWPDHFHTMSKVDILPRHWKRSKYQSFMTKTSHQVLQRSDAKQVAMFAQSCSFLSSTKRYNRGDFLHRHPYHFGWFGEQHKNDMSPSLK